MRFTSRVLALHFVLSVGVIESRAQGHDWRLTLHGAGPVRVGMTIEEASLAAVAYATLVFPEGRTWRGARVGMTEAAVQRLYRHRLESIPAPRGHGGHHWLIYVPSAPADSAYRMVFESDGHRVTSIKAGLWRFASEREGCS